MFRLLLATAILFALTQTGTAEQNNPRGKFFKPQANSVRLDHRELPSWRKQGTLTSQGEQERRSYTGKASWYGDQFHGRRTRYGDVFDMNRVSFAHNTLPEGTVIRVTNLKTGLSVKGPVNDTGDFHKYGRIIDLSREAMRRIGGLHDGVVPVKIEVLHVPQRT